MIKTAYIHLGAHKTGTTTLQHCLRANDKKLIRRGIYPIGRRFPGEKSEDTYKTSVRLPLRRVIKSGRMSKSNERIIAQVRDVLDGRVNQETLVLSDEALAGGRPGQVESLYPHIGWACEVLSQVLKDWRIRIVLYTREQVSFLESCYVQDIQQKSNISFDDFLQKVDLEALSWSQVARSIEEVVGAGSLIVRPFESIRKDPEAYIRDFLEIFTTTRGLKIKTSAGNPSLSGRGIELARLLSNNTTRDEWQVIRNFLQTEFSVKTHEKAKLISDELARQIRARYADDNAKLTSDFPERFPRN